MLDNIKPNTIYTMTDDLHRLFNASGCDPACHCCNCELPVGSQFKLGTVTELHLARAKQREARLGSTFKISKVFKSDKPHEVMLCSNSFCGPDKMINNLSYEPYIRRSERPKIVPARRYGCSIVDGKIEAGM